MEVPVELLKIAVTALEIRVVMGEAFQQEIDALDKLEELITKTE